MLFSLYLLTILYTNTMGLIIIAKCKPIINREIESKGYKIKEKDEVGMVLDLLMNSLKFLIPGYFLSKAIKLTGKDYNIDKIIEDKLTSNEISKNEEESVTNSIFKPSDEKISLSLGRYEKSIPYKASTNSMYPSERYSSNEEIDMDFWEEEEVLEPFIEEEASEKEMIKKEPLQEYIESISDEELLNMANQLDMIRRIKKENEKLLNQKVS